MAIGSGAGAYFGISPEVTPGTYVAPTRFLPGNFTVKREHQTVPVGGYAAAGRLAPVDEIEGIRTPASPIHLDRTPAETRLPPPAEDAQGAEIRDWLRKPPVS